MSKKKMPSIDDLLNPITQEAPPPKSTAAQLRENTSKPAKTNASKPANTQTRKPARTQKSKKPDLQSGVANVSLTGQRKTFSVYVDTGIQMQLDLLKMQLRMMGVDARDASKSLMVETGLLLLLRDFEENQEGSFLFQQAKEQASKRAKK